MGKLIKFELRKLIKSKAFYIICAISIIFVFITGLTLNLVNDIAKAQNLPVDDVNAYTFAKGALGGTFTILIGIFIALFVCEDFSHGISKNVIAKGYSREKVLYSKYIVSLCATLVITILTVLVGFLYGGLAFKNFSTTDNIFVIYLGQFIGVIAYHALFFTLAYTIRRPGFAIAINVVAPVFFTLILTFVDTGLKNAKMNFTVSKYWLDNVFSVFTSANTNPDIIGQNIAFLVVYFAIGFVAGILINRKREVK